MTSLQLAVAVGVMGRSYSQFFDDITARDIRACLCHKILFALFVRRSFRHACNSRKADSLTRGTSALLSSQTTPPVSPASADSATRICAIHLINRVRPCTREQIQYTWKWRIPAAIRRSSTISSRIDWTLRDANKWLSFEERRKT